MYAIIPSPKRSNVTLYLSHLTTSWFLNIFQDESFIGLTRNCFPIPYLFLMGCIKPYLTQYKYQGVCGLGFSMLCHKLKDDRLYRSIFLNSIYSACFGHYTDHCNIIAVSNWFVQGWRVVFKDREVVYLSTKTSN